MKKIFGSFCLLIFIFSYFTTTSFCLITDREVVQHSFTSCSYEVNHTIESLHSEMESNTAVDILSLSSDTDAYNTVSIIFTTDNTDILNNLQLFNNNEEIIGSINNNTKTFIINSKGYLNSIISVSINGIALPADTISIATEIISANSDYNTGFSSTTSLSQEITLIEDVINTFSLSHEESCECEECYTELHPEDCSCEECIDNEELIEESVEEPVEETIEEQVNSTIEEIEETITEPTEEIVEEELKTEEMVEEIEKMPETTEQTSETEKPTDNSEPIIETPVEEIVEENIVDNTEPIETITENQVEIVEEEVPEVIEITENVIELQPELLEEII